MRQAVFIGLFLKFCTLVWAQQAGLYLNLPGTLPHESKNIFTLEVESYCQSKLNEITGEKFTIRKCKMTYNDIPLSVRSCKVRGHSTLYFKRKSLSISLEEPLVWDQGQIRKLALNSLSMDQHYYRNRLSFLLMEKAGIFPLQSAYAELRINHKSAGLYLAVQKPEDFIRALESPLLTRREYEGRYTVEYSDGDDTRSQMKRLRGIPKLTKQYAGQQLYDSLNAVFSLDNYFKWLAFNYLIKNGDYTDELFLYLTLNDDRFDIIPWDYDDIFNSQPHDGFDQRNKVLDHKLLFSAEALLDVVIDSDDYLYLKFLQSFHELLDILTPEIIKAGFEQVYVELYPYFCDQELIAQSASDQYGLTSLTDLRANLQKQFQATLYQLKSVESIIQSELRRLSQ